MAKENIKKFMDLLNGSEDLQKELQKRDSEYAETHRTPADATDEARLEARKAAFQEIMIPLAKEKGFDFTMDEYTEFEEEQLKEGEVDESELGDVAGGVNDGICACYIVGIGFVLGDKEEEAGCIIIGRADATGDGNSTVCWITGK